MKRPLLVWLVFVACAVVGGGVLAWFTSEMLRLDRESAEARRLASLEENIRLALWRMDSALASIHGLEASRTAGDYAPFVRPTTAYSRELEPLAPGAVALPSPLLGYVPPFVRLHFQLEPDGRVHSPQVPEPALRSAAEAAGVSGEQLDAAGELLETLRTRLASANLAEALPPAPLAPFRADTGES